MSNNFTHRLRVYADDTDYGGVVYHANYLKFMEHARTEWLDHLGIPLNELAAEGYFFIIRAASLEYLKPARLNDSLEVNCVMSDLGRSQVAFQQEVRSAEDKEYIFATAVIKLVCVNSELRPVRIPELLIEKIKNSTVIPAENSGNN